MKALLIVGVLALASLSAAQGTQTFVGMITDDMCATKDGHASMRMGPTDAECTTACVAAHGAEYRLKLPADMPLPLMAPSTCWLTARASTR